MNDVSAWNKFYETGKINDYLAYRDLKANVRVARNGVMLNDYGRERDSSVGGNCGKRQEAPYDTY